MSDFSRGGSYAALRRSFRSPKLAVVLITVLAALSGIAALILLTIGIFLTYIQKIGDNQV